MKCAKSKVQRCIVTRFASLFRVYFGSDLFISWHVMGFFFSNQCITTVLKKINCKYKNNNAKEFENCISILIWQCNIYFCSNFALPVGAIQNDFFYSTRIVQSTSCSSECNGISLKTADKKEACTWKRVSGIFVLNLFTFLREGKI